MHRYSPVLLVTGLFAWTALAQSAPTPPPASQSAASDEEEPSQDAADMEDSPGNPWAQHFYFGASGALGPQLTALLTSAPIRSSSAAVSLVSAKAVGHMAPSSMFAVSLKPSVA